MCPLASLLTPATNGGVRRPGYILQVTNAGVRRPGVSTASDKCWDEKTWVGTRLAIETGIINLLTRSLYTVSLE